MNQPQTYMLVHGAWHGAWCWAAVKTQLEKQGLLVFTPTLPGLGERSALLSQEITLDTFIQDICDILIQKNLRNLVLVGHSFGGLVISGVADRLPQRIARLIYLDAFLLPSGKSAFDTLPDTLVQKLEHSAIPSGGLPPPRASTLGLISAAQIDDVQRQMTPHPIGTYRSAMHLDHPLGNGLPVTYIRCVQPVFEPVAGSYQWAKALHGQQWSWQDLACGHDAMISDPDQLSAILLDIGAAKR